MARNIFISYKYKDTLVADLPDREDPLELTKARDYVDLMQSSRMIPSKQNSQTRLGKVVLR